MLLFSKYTQKRLLDILEANLMFDGFVNVLSTLMYSIWGIPSIVLNMIAWSFLGNVKFAVVFANDFCVC